MTVPAGIEGHHALLEYALKQADRMIATLQDRPLLRGISSEDLETELRVEGARRFNVLGRQADRKCAEFETHSVR
jgi:hypothetical protein